MKKFLSVVLTGALLLSLAACAKTVPAEVTGSIEKSAVSASVKEDTTSVSEDTTASKEETNASVEDNTTVAGEENNNAVADNTEAAENNTEESGAVSLGDVTEGVYKNDFFGVKVTTTEGYRFLSDEEITQLGQNTAEVIGDSASNVADAIKNGTVITPMYVSDLTGLNSLGLTVSSLGIAGSFISPADIIDASLDQIVQMLTGSGFENVTAERSTTTVMGEEVDCMIVHGTYMGLELFEKQFEIIKDGYMASFTATSYVNDTTDTQLAMISSLN